MIFCSSKNPRKLFFRCKNCGFYRFWEPKNDEINMETLYYGECQIIEDEAITSIHKEENLQSVERLMTICRKNLKKNHMLHESYNRNYLYNCGYMLAT